MPNVTIPPASRRHVPVDDAPAARRGSADAEPKDMRQAEILALQTYLRKLFGTDRIALVAPKRHGGGVELRVGDEFIGTAYRDEEDGEVSYALQVAILAEDLEA
jgi:hypothetical protein